MGVISLVKMVAENVVNGQDSNGRRSQENNRR